MRKGISPGGFAYEFDEVNADDMRLVDALAICMDPDTDSFATVSAASRAAEILLGKEQKRRLYDHIGKAHGGRVPAQDLMTELEGIMSGTDAEKNS